MNPEQPIPFPKDLDEDWKLAQITPAHEEPSPTILDKYRQEAVPVPDFYAPNELLLQPSGYAEPEVDELRQLLRAALDERPDVIVEPTGGETTRNETRYAMVMMGRDYTNEVGVYAAHWARRVGFMIAGIDFDKSSEIHCYFGESLEDKKQWAAAVMATRNKYKDDEGMKRCVELVTSFMAKESWTKQISRDMIHLVISQVEYWREVQSIRSTKRLVDDLEHESNDGVIIEPSPVITQKAGPNRYDANELTLSPLSYFIDPVTNELIASRVPEGERSAQSQVVWDALTMWRNKGANPEGDPLDMVHTRSMLNRVGAPGDPRVAAAHWMRRIVFRNADISFDRAAQIHDRYNADHVMTNTQWKEHTLNVKREHLARGSELDNLIDTCMELGGIPSTAHDLCKRIAAVAHEEVAYWQRISEFEAEITKTFEGKYWLRSLLHYLRRSEEAYPSKLQEPSFEHTPRGLAATMYSEDDLVELPIDTIFSRENGDILPSEFAEPQTGLLRAIMEYAIELRKKADKQIKLFESYSQLSIEHARMIVGEKRPNDGAVAYRARFLAFGMCGVEYDKHHWGVHHNAKMSSASDAEVAQKAMQAVRGVNNNVILSTRLEACLPFIADNEEEVSLARSIACLTLKQIYDWQENQLTIEDIAKNRPLPDAS